MADHDHNRRTAGLKRTNAARERLRHKAEDPDEAPAAGVVPVVAVEADDPRMAAATAEAVGRFGEFLAALAARRPGETFAVKVPFADERGREFMWVAVAAVDDDAIDGHLDNDPAVVAGVRAGDPVRVPRADVCDWLYVRGGQLHGGFTLKLLGGHLGPDLRTGDAA